METPARAARFPAVDALPRGASGSGQRPRQHPERVLAEGGADLALAPAVREQAVDERGEARRVECGGHRAVEVRAERDVLDAGDVLDVPQGAHDVRDGGATD